MNNNDDPLEKLLISESQAVNKTDLFNLLSPYILIKKESKSFDFIGEFDDLPNAEKILVILAGVKAKSLILDTDDRITPLEIIKMEIAPEGSIKGTLKSLLDSKEIKSEKGKYYLPNYKISQVVERLKKINKK